MSNCGEIGLDIHTYYAGGNQATHPNVVAFEEPWNGYRFYMGYTPYPYANGAEENPSIAVSNDLVNWEKPDGLINPIACCEETECDELKDTHLLYRADLNRLEMWYLGRIKSSLKQGGALYVFRKTSRDGIQWSTYEVMYQFREFNLASPSVHWNGEKYEFWGIRHDRDDIGLYYMTSLDGDCWSPLRKCMVPQARETDMWHGAVAIDSGKVRFVWVGHGGKHRNYIYMADGVDSCNFFNTRIIIRNDTKWNFLYRPCIVRVDNTCVCYYGAIRKDGKWLITMSRGADWDQLRGIERNAWGKYQVMQRHVFPTVPKWVCGAA